MPHIHDKYDFTVSFFLVHPTEKLICLHWHKKLQLWNNYGGHIELDEHPGETIEKEMFEETGLTPDDYDIVETYDGPKNVGVIELPNPFGMHAWKYADLDHWHIDLPYIMKCKTAELKPQEKKSEEFKWLSLDEIHELYSKKMVDDGVLKICEWIFANHM